MPNFTLNIYIKELISLDSTHHIKKKLLDPESITSFI